MHSQGESKSSWLLPSWQILHISRSLKGLQEKEGHLPVTRLETVTKRMVLRLRVLQTFPSGNCSNRHLL